MRRGCEPKRVAEAIVDCWRDYTEFIHRGNGISMAILDGDS